MSTPTEALQAKTAALRAKLDEIQLGITSLEHRIATDRRRAEIQATRARRYAVYMLVLVTLARIRAYGNVWFSDN